MIKFNFINNYLSKDIKEEVKKLAKKEIKRLKEINLLSDFYISCKYGKYHVDLNFNTGKYDIEVIN